MGCLPFWTAAYLPLMDLPQHVAVIAELSRFATDPHAQATYTVHLFPNSNVLFQVLGWGLSGPVGVDAAVRLALSLGMLAWALASGALARALGARPIAGVLGLPLALGYPLASGYVNFWLAWPAAMGVWALLLRGGRRGLVGAAALAVAAFLAHVQVWGFLLVTVPVVAVLSRAREAWRRALVEAAATMGPGSLLALAWLVPSLGHHGTGDWRDAGGGHLRWESGHAWMLGVWVRQFWITYNEPTQGLALGLWLAAVAAAALDAGLSRRITPLAIPAIGAWVASVVLPEHAINQFYIASRMVAPAALLTVLSLAPRGRLGGLAAGLGTAAWLVQVGTVGRAWEQVEPEAAGLREVVAAADPNLRMVAVTQSRGSVHAAEEVFLHAASWNTVDNGGEAAFSFTSFQSSPLRYADLAPKWHLRPGQELHLWCSLVNGKLPAYDLYLLRAVGDRCAVRAHLEAAGALVAESGDWALFAVNQPIPAWTAPESCGCK